MFNKIIKNNTTNKNFSYEKDKVTLNFTLNLDNKKQIEIFLELLKVAQEDVKNELKPVEYNPGAGAGYQNIK